MLTALIGSEVGVTRMPDVDQANVTSLSEPILKKEVEACKGWVN